MGQTIAEKIISSHVGRPVRPDEVVIVPVDGVMATDATGPFAIQAFGEIGGSRLWKPDRVVLAIDHASPAPNLRVGNLHRMMREFAREKGCHLYDVGAGIGHQVMVENGHVRPGEVVIGADSHSVIYGAVGAFSTGVGATDLAALMHTGKIWLRVPSTLKVEFSGQLSQGVFAKDMILFLAGQIGISGATYQAIEYTGSAVESLSLAGRMVIASMAVEMGAKAGIVNPKGLELPYEFDPVFPDEDASYQRVLRFDAGEIKPQASLPHSPDQVVSLEEILGTPVDLAFIGTCTNGRLEDLHTVANILRDHRIAPGLRMIVAPASRQVFDEALSDGTIEALSRAGVAFITPGCGPCVGTHLGVPGDGEVVISSANRNFQGRMGNPNARIYLASPATVATSALHGVISLPSGADSLDPPPGRQP